MSPKLFLASGVLAIHGLAIAVCCRHVVPPTDSALAEAPVFTDARIIFEPPDLPKLPMPEVRLTSVHPDMGSLRAVQFDDLDDFALAGIIGSSSAPRLRTIQSVDATPFARRAGLGVGQAKTVILVAQIGEDGLPNAVDVARSSGDGAADMAAVDYALALRWIPGTRDRRPKMTRIRFPITLAIQQ